jgi:hypothetical protein
MVQTEPYNWNVCNFQVQLQNPSDYSQSYRTQDTLQASNQAALWFASLLSSTALYDP